MNINSTKKITQVSAPEKAECARSDDGTSATVKIFEPMKKIVVFYRSSEMKYPQLFFAEHPEYPDEVAVCASFVPTFEPPAP